MTGRLQAAVLAGALLAGALPGDADTRGVTAADDLIAATGGLYRDGALTSYVGTVGRRLVEASGRPAQGWSFGVLDTPESNAFTLPGGRILVTRGMLALANDEAELATVLAHEIGHALAGDGQAPASDRARRAAEVAADRTGLRLLLRSGYDPGAQADFLRSLRAERALTAHLGGLAPGPSGAPDHPALGDRLKAAEREARGRAGTGVRNREAYLAAIDGITWGDGPAQGILRGRRFVHPDLGFAFDAPPGYEVSNLPDAVVASGPRGAMLLMDSIENPGGSPEDYLARGWAPEIARGIRAGPLEDVRRGRLNGLSMAQGELAMTSNGSARVAELTVVKLRDRFYRLTGLRMPDDAASRTALAAAAGSFRPLSRGEAARARPLHLRIHRVARGEDVAALAAAMPVGPGARARFDVMNGLSGGKVLHAGDLVKLVAE